MFPFVKNVHALWDATATPQCTSQSQNNISDILILSIVNTVFNAGFDIVIILAEGMRCFRIAMTFQLF